MVQVAAGMGAPLVPKAIMAMTVPKTRIEEEEEIRVECSLQDVAARPELCSFVASQSPAPAAPFRSRVKSQSGLR